jgi:hypothetical protein
MVMMTENELDGAFTCYYFHSSTGLTIAFLCVGFDYKFRRSMADLFIWKVISNQFWYFFILYVREILFRSSSDNDVMYLFQPGHQFACHRHKRPIRDRGSLSYRALKAQFSQLCFAICSPYLVKLHLIPQFQGT